MAGELGRGSRAPESLPLSCRQGHYPEVAEKEHAMEPGSRGDKEHDSCSVTSGGHGRSSGVSRKMERASREELGLEQVVSTQQRSLGRSRFHSQTSVWGWQIQQMKIKEAQFNLNFR